eukprot:365939-Chlamydomonas_euryale.AAC.7
MHAQRTHSTQKEVPVDGLAVVILPSCGWHLSYQRSISHCRGSNSGSYPWAATCVSQNACRRGTMRAEILGIL